MKEENYPTGAFVAFVLLSQNEWDIKKLINDCKADWNIEIPYDGNEEALLPLQVGTYPCGAVHGRGRLLLQVPRRPVQDFFLLPRRLGAGRLREREPGREAAL